MILRRIVEITWLAIAMVSIVVFFYLLLTEGFINGKAYIYCITAAAGFFMFYVRRKQRLIRKNKEYKQQVSTCRNA